jgi:hypothetical protein
MIQTDRLNDYIRKWEDDEGLELSRGSSFEVQEEVLLPSDEILLLDDEDFGDSSIDLTETELKEELRS